MVGLFQLGYRLDYKKGTHVRRSAGFATLASHLESIPELKLGSSHRWAEMRATLAAPAPGDLNRLEDELDAVLCAHLAWLWQHRRESLHVYGSVESGYIVAPRPPTHRPVRPVKAAPTPSDEGKKAFERAVAGRPTGYSAGDHERRWKQSVRAAFAECSLPAGSVTVEAQFRMAPDQRGRNEPDLDNLIKATVDALGGVLGIRAGTANVLRPMMCESTESSPASASLGQRNNQAPVSRCRNPTRYDLTLARHLAAECEPGLWTQAHAIRSHPCGRCSSAGWKSLSRCSRCPAGPRGDARHAPQHLWTWLDFRARRSAPCERGDETGTLAASVLQEMVRTWLSGACWGEPWTAPMNRFVSPGMS
jgi:hypothetical protein